MSDADINAGEWLIDPIEILINNTLAKVIKDALASGDVTINATTGSSTVNTSDNETGGSNGQIVLFSDIIWDSQYTLFLEAINIYVRATIENQNKDSGGVVFKVAADGDVLFPKDTFSGDYLGKLVINSLNQLHTLNDLMGGEIYTNRLANQKALSGNYELGSDIDASDTSQWNYDSDSAEYKGWKPMGYDFGTGLSDNIVFTGAFNGGGYTISNLTINRTSRNDNNFKGFFGAIEGATIENVRLTDVKIAGNYIVGGLVGHSEKSTITNSYVTGDVVGRGDVGGLVGNSQNSTITDSHATGTFRGTNPEDLGNIVGGLIGFSQSSTIINSYATGQVIGEAGGVGGLIGTDLASTITDSYATGDVIGRTGGVGGLIGTDFSSTITDSYATGDVMGDLTVENAYESNYIGGLVGQGYQTTIINSYATGDVGGVDYIGGLVGGTQDGIITSETDIGSTIINSYATGKVSGSSYVGGLLGIAGFNNHGLVAITNSFYNLDDNAELTYTTIGTGKSLAQLQDIETFNNAPSSTWDISYTDDTAIPNLDTNYKYPILVKVGDEIVWKIYTTVIPDPDLGTDPGTADSDPTPI